MLGMNPTRDTGDRMPTAWNANSASSRMGFANRDAQSTRGCVLPAVFKRLGDDIAWNVGGRPRSEIAFSWGSYRIPGYMVLEFEPVLAAEKNHSERLTDYAFLELYREINRVYTSASNRFEAADLQVITYGIALLKMYVALYERALDIAHTNCDATNAYISPAPLLKASINPNSTWNPDITRLDYHTEATNWNRDVIARINRIIWFSGILPGEDRWASLVSELYKDTGAATNYAQIYLFTPAAFYMPSYGSEGWFFERQAMPEGLAGLRKKIAEFVDRLFYDPRSSEIQTAIIATLSKENRRVSIADNLNYLSFSYYPEDGRDVVLTYDPQMLMAIHNATLCGPVVVSDVKQIHGDTSPLNPLGSHLAQTFRMPFDVVNRCWFATPDILNMPSHDETRFTLINAMQWHIVREASVGETDDTIPPEVLGTDILTRAFVVYFDGPAPYSDASHFAYFTFNSNVRPRYVVTVPGDENHPLNNLHIDYLPGGYESDADLGLRDAAYACFDYAPIRWDVLVPASYNVETKTYSVQ